MQRRSFLAAAGTGLAASGLAAPRPARAQAKGSTLLVAHGAWSAGWVWRKMHPLLAASGHRLITPTYTGLGERAHLATPSVDLDTHVQDMLGVIQTEELKDFVLIAHSYGGMVGTAVADRVPELIRKVIYLDAFAPRDGQSLLSLQPESARQAMRDAVKAGDGWRVQPSAPPPDTSPEDAKWINAHRMPHPFKCFDTPVKLANGDMKIPRAYIYCLRKTP
ncbi:MAG TPA: alpha/beta hydrolase, partial [Steroidobacteraceae bacterium]|nr:alpha/beta hydrolase [Steroidobacteraceae bacterium]